MIQDTCRSSRRSSDQGLSQSDRWQFFIAATRLAAAVIGLLDDVLGGHGLGHL